MKTYFISGMGADERAFSKLTLNKEVEMIHLPWMAPEPNETMAHYAMRMADKIEDPKNSALVGTSFGGIMAVEMSKQIRLGKTILLNTAKHRGELPPNLRMIGWSGVHKLVPVPFLMQRKKLAGRFFGARTPEQKIRLGSFLDAADPGIVKWSIDRLVKWTSDIVPNVTHIHGTADSVFPCKYVKADHWVKGGPHFMVFTHAPEVSDLLNKVLLDQ